MQGPTAASIRAFVVFEPSYSLGCLALLSSLGRHASRPITVDILMRAQYLAAADQVIDRLSRALPDKLTLHPVIMPSDALKECDAFNFGSHFIPEILFRLYYADLVDARMDFAIYLDLDMIVLGDIYSIEQDLEPSAMLHVVEAGLFGGSRAVMPPGITRYLNSGLLVFDAADRRALRARLDTTRKIVSEISARSQYLDQDAINIGFYDDMHYLSARWNFTLEHFKGGALPPDVAILHATGSRKPWFFRGGHPFTAWYRREVDLLGLSFFERYDFGWAQRRALKKLRAMRTPRTLQHA